MNRCNVVHGRDCDGQCNTTCYRCGLLACKSCSVVIPYGTRRRLGAKHRIGFDCLDEMARFNDLDYLVEMFCPQTFFLATVKKQRSDDDLPEKMRRKDIPSVVGQWVTEWGFTTDIRKAQVFGSMAEVKGRLPLLWEFEVHEFKLNRPAFTLTKEGYNG